MCVVVSPNCVVGWISARSKYERCPTSPASALRMRSKVVAICSEGMSDMCNFGGINLEFIQDSIAICVHVNLLPASDDLQYMNVITAG
jgi:hypothetical protein